MNSNASVINAYLQSELNRQGKPSVTAVEAARWLDSAGLLKDSASHPGLPLRKLLRRGLIRNSHQNPKAVYSEKGLVSINWILHKP